MQDEESWLTGFRGVKSFPLLFAEGLSAERALMAVLRVPGRVEGTRQDRLPGGERFAVLGKRAGFYRGNIM